MYKTGSPEKTPKNKKTPLLRKAAFSPGFRSACLGCRRNRLPVQITPREGTYFLLNIVFRCPHVAGSTYAVVSEMISI